MQRDTVQSVGAKCSGRILRNTENIFGKEMPQIGKPTSCDIPARETLFAQLPRTHSQILFRHSLDHFRNVRRHVGKITIQSNQGLITLRLSPLDPIQVSAPDSELSCAVLHDQSGIMLPHLI